MPTGDVVHYMAPTGCSDANNGTSPATPWCTPNHAMKCGDVIVAAPGNYTTAQFADQWGVVSGCSSLTGGINGNGGAAVAVVLCGGATLNTCFITTAGGGFPTTMVEFQAPNQNRWALEGFNIAGPAASRAVGVRACGGEGIAHHILLINSIVTNSMQGFGSNDCGAPGANGMDYVAVVGSIFQDANHNGNFQDGICVSAIDGVGLAPFDAVAGTHVYFVGNFGMNNQAAPGCVNVGANSSYDGEFIMIDSAEFHNFNGKIVIANNLGYDAMRQCITLTSGGGGNAFEVDIYQNTCFHDNVNDGTNEGDNGEINPESFNGTMLWHVTLQDNIAFSDFSPSTGGALTYAMDIWGNIPTITHGGTGHENIYKGSAASCAGGTGCDAGNNSNTFNTIPLGVQFYENPSFTNSAHALSNHIAAPDCTGFITTTACMGWDAITGTLTSLSVISDMTANCAHCGDPHTGNGKGYQYPSLSCVTSGRIFTDFPAWLGGGVIYLHYEGAGLITQRAGLITMPCAK